MSMVITVMSTGSCRPILTASPKGRRRNGKESAVNSSPPGAVLNYPSRPVATRGLAVAVSEVVHAEVVDSEQAAREKARRYQQAKTNGAAR
jgi:hypothetical protein